jgi:hypothetical protein
VLAVTYASLKLRKGRLNGRHHQERPEVM